MDKHSYDPHLLAIIHRLLTIIDNLITQKGGITPELVAEVDKLSEKAVAVDTALNQAP